MKKGTFCAFTLAEVLITLGIIGIVAALTIPSLMQKSANSANAKALIKYYAAFSNAINMYITDNGTDFLGSGAFANGNDNTLIWDEFFKKYFQFNQDCFNTSGCFPLVGYERLSGGGWQTLRNAGGGTSRAVLSDGTLVRVWNPNTNCSGYCLEIIVDVNGYKSPNKAGRDTFVFWLLKNKIVPYPSNDCDISNAGFGCSSKVLQEGKINY